MRTQLVSQPSYAHCYDCYKREVVKVCHHCGRGVCDAHQHGARPAKKDGPAADEAKLSESAEFAMLGLQEEIKGNSVVTHCRNCAHSVRSFKRQRTLSMVLMGFGLAAMAVVAGLFSTGQLQQDTALLLGGLGLAVALVAAAAFLVTNRLHRKHFLDQLPPFPLVARLRLLEARETIQGTVLLNAEGKYEVKDQQVRGRLTVSQESTEHDRQRLASYRKARGVKRQADVPFLAGFLVLDGAPTDGALEKPPPNIQLTATDTVQANTIAIRGTTREQPFLASEEGKGSRVWQKSYDYVIPHKDSGKPELPVQLIPSLPLEGEQRVLCLDVQVPPWPATMAGASQLHIDQLVLRAPQNLGDVILATPDCTISPEGEHQEITWEAEDREPAADGASSRSFCVRFENKILPDTVFQGHLRLTFASTTSGLRSVTYFYPWGQERCQAVTSANTEQKHVAGTPADLPAPDNSGTQVVLQTATQVDVGFTLHCAALPMQEMLTLTARQTRRAVSPNSELVIALANSLTTSGMYVKRCVESRPQTSIVGANVTNRAWDLAGRYYAGLYPTDFHLALTGEQVRRQAGQDWLQADMTVQAIVTDDAMRGNLSAFQRRLAAIIEDTLDEFSRAAAAQAAGTTPDAATEALRARLRELQIKLDEALLSGQISEARYEEMRARYLRELAQLERGPG